MEATLEGLQRQKHQLEALLPDTALKAAQVAHLQSTYGLEAVALIEPAEPSRREPISPLIPLCVAERDYRAKGFASAGLRGFDNGHCIQAIGALEVGDL